MKSLTPLPKFSIWYLFALMFSYWQHQWNLLCGSKQVTWALNKHWAFLFLVYNKVVTPCSSHSETVRVVLASAFSQINKLERQRYKWRYHITCSPTFFSQYQHIQVYLICTNIFRLTKLYHASNWQTSYKSAQKSCGTGILC